MFGKALGNGYAINAILGKRKIMKHAESTFISSTFWTERIGPTAALKTLEIMERIKSWKIITSKGKKVIKEWKKLSKKYNLEIVCTGIPALARFEIKSKNFNKYKALITQEFLKENIFKRAVDAVKNWVSRFLTKVWNKIKTFLIQGLDIALNILGIKISESSMNCCLNLVAY